jgi:hypothetical protein
MATTSMTAHTDQLLNSADRWSRGVRKSDGLAFVLFTGSKGAVYFSTETACSCPGYRHRGICAHQQAVTFSAIAARTAAFAPKVRYEDILGFGDDLESAF